VSPQRSPGVDACGPTRPRVGPSLGARQSGGGRQSPSLAAQFADGLSCADYPTTERPLRSRNVARQCEQSRSMCTFRRGRLTDRVRRRARPSRARTPRPRVAGLGRHTTRTRTLMSDNDHRRIVLRRDPPPGQGHRSAARRDQLHQPGVGGARACLPGLARFHHDPGRAAAAPRAAPRVLEPPTLLRHGAAPNADKPDTVGVVA
jgi:hypothetical protein